MSFHEDFFHHLAVGAYRTRPDGTVEHANDALVQMLGYPSLDDLRAANAEHFYNDRADRAKWLEAMTSAPEGRTVHFETTWRRHDDSRVIRIRLSARALRTDGEITAFEGIVSDISDLARSTPPPQPGSPDPSKAWPDQLKEKLPIPISRKDRSRRITWANEEFCRLEKVTLEELLTTKNTDRLLYGEHMDAIYRESDERVLSTGQPFVTTDLHKAEGGALKQVMAFKIPLFDEAGEVSGLEIYFWDEALIRQPLEQAKETARRFERLLTSRYKAWFENDFAQQLTRANEDFTALTGYSQDEVSRLTISRVIAPEDLGRVQKSIRDMRHSPEQPTNLELEIMAADGTRIPVDLTSRVITERGQPKTVVTYLRDLTRRREDERRRTKEIHHRIKNNLQTIYSLLGSEVGRAEDPRIIEILTACRARVLVMAELHRSLYEFSSIEEVKLQDYLQNLADKLVKTYQRKWQRITARVNVPDDVHLSLDALTPCTLVIHELVSNAMKHAFPEPENRQTERSGTIFISLGRETDYHFRLLVSDTGCGMVRIPDLEKARSLGLRLVHGLIMKQLRGKIQLDTGSTGTSYTSSFKDPTPLTPSTAP